MTALSAPIAGLVLGGQEPVHGANGAVIMAFIEQGGIDRRRRLVGEPLAVEHAEKTLLLGDGEGQRRWSVAPIRDVA